MDKSQVIKKIITSVNEFCSSFDEGSFDFEQDDEHFKIHVENYLKLNAKNASSDTQICDLLSYYLGDYSYYDIQEDESYHGLKDELVKFHSEYKSSKKKDSKTTTVKSAVKSKLKKVGSKVIVRKVARNLTNKTQQLLVNYLAGPDALNDSSLKGKLSAFLSTDVGQGLFKGMIGVLIELVPFDKIPGGEAISTPLLEVAEELQTQAGDQMTIPIENAAAFILPMMQEALLPLLTSQNQTKQLTK